MLSERSSSVIRQKASVGVEGQPEAPPQTGNQMRREGHSESIFISCLPVCPRSS